MAHPAPPSPLLHIATAADWEEAQARGRYEPASLASEGFVHCSWPAQIAGVAARFFRGQPGLVLLVIDAERVRCPIRHENLEGGDGLFPHVYGALELDAVIEVRRLRTDPDGAVVLPCDF